MDLTDEQRAEIARHLAEALSEDQDGRRGDLLSLYLAEPDGSEVKGRSQFTDSSAADAVEAILPEIMDIVTGSEHFVEFAPVGPEDEEAAKQETAVVSHIFWDKNPGFATLYTWVKEALIQQNAYVSAGWCEKRRTEIEEYEDLTFEEAQQVFSELEGDYEVQEQTGLMEVADSGEAMLGQELDEAGHPVPISLRIRCVKETKEYVIEPFPQEDFFVTPRWGKLTLEGAPCCGRVHTTKTREDWIAFGFSEDSLDGLSEGSADEEVKAARHHTKNVDEAESSVEYIEIAETYIRMDLDGDGSPELVRIWCDKSGGTVLEWGDGTEAVEEVSKVPIYGLTPYIMSHRHIGRAVAEVVEGIQRVKTVLMRHTLDSIYTTLYKRPHFDENSAGEFLESDLANPAPGAAVRTGEAEVTYPQTGAESIPAATLPMMEKLDNLQEVRTGATRYNQGLDADSLNKTATGIKEIMGASQKKTRLIARTLVETGIRDLFLCIHQDLRAGPMREVAIKLRGTWQHVNPRTWKHRTDMRVNVGMGRGDKDERRAALNFTAQVQRELVSAGSRMVDEGKLFATITDILETYGVSGSEKYFYNPANLPPPPPPDPPPPDPIMISANAQAQKLAADAQRDAAKMQADERQREREHEHRMAQLRLKELDLTNRIQNEGETLDLKRKEIAMKDDLERDKLDVQGTPAVPYDQVTGDTD